MARSLASLPLTARPKGFPSNKIYLETWHVENSTLLLAPKDSFLLKPITLSLRLSFSQKYRILSQYSCTSKKHPELDSNPKFLKINAAYGSKSYDRISKHKKPATIAGFRIVNSNGDPDWTNFKPSFK
jgi:hypothetical protein